MNHLEEKHFTDHILTESSTIGQYFHLRKEQTGWYLLGRNKVLYIGVLYLKKFIYQMIKIREISPLHFCNINPNSSFTLQQHSRILGT